MKSAWPWIGLATLLLLAVGITLYFRKRMSTWIWPVQGRITSPYGPRIAPVTGASVMHNGIDIEAPIGTPVRAPRAGRVTWVANMGNGGMQMKLTHPDGWQTGYAHLSERMVDLGADVKQGDIIALSGATGNVSGPHLHLTLRDPEGNAVDPMKYLT